MSDRVVYRLQCAAITNGCMASIAFQDRAGLDLAEIPGSYTAERFLVLNGWHIDHGRWVCGAHPVSCHYPEGSAERAQHMAGQPVRA